MKILVLHHEDETEQLFATLRQQEEYDNYIVINDSIDNGTPVEGKLARCYTNLVENIHADFVELTGVDPEEELTVSFLVGPTEAYYMYKAAKRQELFTKVEAIQLINSNLSPLSIN